MENANKFSCFSSQISAYNVAYTFLVKIDVTHLSYFVCTAVRIHPCSEIGFSIRRIPRRCSPRTRRCGSWTCTWEWRHRTRSTGRSSSGSVGTNQRPPRQFLLLSGNNWEWNQREQRGFNEMLRSACLCAVCTYGWSLPKPLFDQLPLWTKELHRDQIEWLLCGIYLQSFKAKL